MLKSSISLAIVFAGAFLNPNVTADESNIIVPITHSQIQVMGRTLQKNDSIQLGYPGVTVQFITDAKSVSLNASSNTSTSTVDVFVDDKFLKTITLPTFNDSIQIFAQPTNTPKHVTLVNRSESWNGVPTFNGLILEQGGLMQPKPLPQKKLMIIGDSITCGAMIDRAHICEKSPELTNPYQSYGMKLARMLNTQVHLVCFSGRGLTRSWDGKEGEQQAPNFINFTIPTMEQSAVWDHSKYIPDVILIALGTNDFNLGIPNQQHFVSTYLDFIKTLISHYPNAKFSVTASAMVNDFNINEQKRSTLESYLRQVKQQASIYRPITIAPSSYQPGDNCDPHPIASQHTIMADELMDSISKLLL
uniref:SGNH/GDSL hydrolase family protein n=1 Tax=Shewanella gaetbuli TaxID=220752 RepID=UPI003B5AF9A8